jgi:hypothetical protein
MATEELAFCLKTFLFIYFANEMQCATKYVASFLKQRSILH